jgi:hypothetical protein
MKALMRELGMITYQSNIRYSRVGQFLRLDDNGSWQQQCFKRKDSVTHSHDEKKEKITLWWKSDREDSATIQFVYFLSCFG